MSPKSQSQPVPVLLSHGEWSTFMCHESEVPVDIFPGPAKHSIPEDATPQPRLSNLPAEGGCSLSIKGWSFHILDAGPPNARFPLATDIFLELVTPFTNTFFSQSFLLPWVSPWVF